ncbi:MAG: AAA family ATPase [Smithellaceae bacterium]|jgi:predicted ATPase|nr:AAA family ATPase [Smithellaceae bacterium]
MHLNSVKFHPEKYPTKEVYPFSLSLFHKTKIVNFSPITLFVGENGTGKSTLLEAVAIACGIHIWRNFERSRPHYNPYEDKLCNYITVEWQNGRVPGSFFGSQIFRHFAELLDTWAAADRGQLDYFGGKSLTTQSHGQSLMSFFESRYKIKGIYFLDEPETALSPKSQIELLFLLDKMSRTGHAQFIIATHSPILLACPNAKLYSFDNSEISYTSYEQTQHYRLYKSFFDQRDELLNPKK